MKCEGTPITYWCWFGVERAWELGRPPWLPSLQRSPCWVVVPQTHPGPVDPHLGMYLCICVFANSYLREHARLDTTGAIHFTLRSVVGRWWLSCNLSARVSSELRNNCSRCHKPPEGKERMLSGYPGCPGYHHKGRYLGYQNYTIHIRDLIWLFHGCADYPAWWQLPR